jgi:hypothetical protein
MQKILVIILLLISHLSFGQMKYKQVLDSLSICFEQLDFATDFDGRKSGLKLISKYHPAYIQTFVGDGTEIVTDEMIKENKVYKALSNNKKSVIILSSRSLVSGWIVVIDLKQLDTNKINLSNDTITISDLSKGFKCNVSHRLWKGLIETKTVKLYGNSELSKHTISNKTYYYLKLAMLTIN